MSDLTTLNCRIYTSERESNLVSGNIKYSCPTVTVVHTDEYTFPQNQLSFTEYVGITLYTDGRQKTPVVDLTLSTLKRWDGNNLS